jgi:hypothetical protein
VLATDEVVEQAPVETLEEKAEVRDETGRLIHMLNVGVVAASVGFVGTNE